MNGSQELITVTIQKGENLHDALQKLDIAPDLPCGGNGTCGLCSVQVEKFGKVRSCQFRLAGTYRVSTPQRTPFDVVNAASGIEAEEEAYDAKHPQVAIDIGTTTVAWSIRCQDRTLSGGFVNPQRRFGADVMSRIRQCEAGHLEEMQHILAEKLEGEIAAGLVEILQGAEEEKADIAIAANTTMLHILNGWDCGGLGMAPFAPKSLSLHTWDETAWKRQIRTEWMSDWDYHVTELPGISAFIGADVASGIYALNMQNAKKPVLLLDLGTNGEMAIGCNGRLLAVSTAAGPAFEASEVALSVHASGLLKILHEMLRTGAMDATGLLADSYFERGYPAGEVVISQELIRELQMAKAAIRAGIEVLIKEYGIAEDEVEAVYLAGGMGYYIDPEDAIAVGLIPSSFKNKVSAAGNTCMRGLLKFLRDPEDAGKQLSDITNGTKELLLADHPEFEDLYIRYMDFPRKENGSDAMG